MSKGDERAARAAERRQRATLRKTSLQDASDPSPLSGEAALSLVWVLTQESWALSGKPIPTYTRDETPYRFVARKS